MAKSTAAEPVGGKDDDEDLVIPEEPRPGWMTAAGWVAAVFSVLCMVTVSVIWISEQDEPYDRAPDETVITTAGEALGFAQANAHTGVDNDDPATYIPTGVMVQALEFKGPYTLQMAGYLWQRYPANREDIDRAVVFPEADTTVFYKVFEVEQGDEVLVGWSFKTTLRERFDYGPYPLDRQELSLRIWHVDFEKNVFLIPDINGYVDLNPNTLPGIDPQLVLENWKVEQSYFSYRLATYNADFGILGYDPTVPNPELYFNIGTERYLLGPLFSQGIAPFIILLQLFVLVDGDRAQLETAGDLRRAAGCGAVHLRGLRVRGAHRAERVARTRCAGPRSCTSRGCT